MPAFIADPTNFPLRFDFNQGFVKFIKLSREEIADSAFLDHRAPGADVSIAAMPIKELENRWLEAEGSNNKLARKPVYIFHTAFCSSTLICRCLDAPGKTLTLKEPALLVDISSARRFGAPQVKAEFRDILQLGVRVLSRAFEGESHVIIKPSNGANDLLPDLLNDNPQAKALLLFTDIRTFLISVIKRGEQGRQFARMLLRHPWGGDARLSGLTGDEALQLTDLQVAALAWNFQVESFMKALVQFSASRVRALDAESFRHDSVLALSAIDEFFELHLGQSHIKDVIDGPIFKTDSKQRGRAFNPEEHRKMTLSIEDEYGNDLDAVIKWVEQLPFERSRPLTSTLLQQVRKF